MGNDLRGRELGKGIVQRKDKMFSARFTGKNGKRYEKHFSTANQAKRWLIDAKYEDAHNSRENSLFCSFYFTVEFVLREKIFSKMLGF